MESSWFQEAEVRNYSVAQFWSQIYGRRNLTPHPHPNTSIFEIVHKDFRQLLGKELELPNCMQMTLLRKDMILRVLEIWDYFDGQKENIKLVSKDISIPIHSRAGVLALVPYVLGSRRVAILSPYIAGSDYLPITFGLNGHPTYFERIGLVKTPQQALSYIQPVKVMKRSTQIIMACDRLVLFDTKCVSENCLTFNMGTVMENFKERMETFPTIIVENYKEFPTGTKKYLEQLFPHTCLLFISVTM